MNGQTTVQTALKPTVAAVALLCLVGARPAMAASGSWTRRADMPMAVSATAGCAVDGIFYVIGGLDRSFRQLRTVFAYDPRTDTWTRKADLPTARSWPAVVPVDGIIYTIGGARRWEVGTYNVEGTGTVEAYDPKTDQWMTRASMPTPRACLSVCAVGGIIYAIGGLNRGSGTAKVEAYDPKTNQWSSRTSVPRPLPFSTAGAVDGLIYAFHGTDTLVYDPKAEGWARRAPIPVSTQMLASSVVGGVIYLLGGSSDTWVTTYDLTIGYDPVRDEFTPKQKMPRTRLGHCSATIDGKIYVAGGASQEPIVHPDAIFYQALDEFDPQRE